MIQSPRGLINVAAQDSFQPRVTENKTQQNTDILNTSSSLTNQTEIENQLVWSNPGYYYCFYC